MNEHRLFGPNLQRSCILIAAFYERGLARGDWTTQAGAVDTLGVSPAELSLALKMDELPATVIDLFKAPAEITPYSVRVIRDVIARDGLETVLQRIGQHVADGSKLSMRAVLATVKGQVSASKRALRRYHNIEKKILEETEDSPRNIADRYHLGVTKGHWTSYSGCARALNISRKKIRDATHISALWLSLPNLFHEAELTFAVGRKLLALDKDCGRQVLLQRARIIHSRMRGIETTSETILREFNDENVRPSDLSCVRIRRGRGTKRLIIECDHPDFLFQYRRELEFAIRSALKKITVSSEQIEFNRLLSNHSYFKTAFPRFSVT
ncbi:hypothetical protein [Paraburkholderia sp. SIMBA_030]|uniref:hypothetical protein n=1 Tax=Paraburkholderia sp. SIMBA_030 TaxID=3085773 RepID=UPI0039794389